MKKLNLFLLSFSVLLFTACDVLTGLVAGNSAVTIVPSPSSSSVSAAPSSSVGGSPSPSPSSTVPVVCDPLGPPESVAGSQNGLLGHLYYTPAGGTEYTQVEDYINNDPQFPASLFFNQLNVPTRSFSEGFATQNGTLLMDPITGNTLYEWFALHFDSEIRLGSEDQPGRYQIAVLSDDGSILDLDQGNGFQQFINNDGTTPSRLACASTGIDFNWSTSIPMKLDYFQGPRYNIALMLLWREIPEVSSGQADLSSSLSDVACGQAGNDTFFLWENPPDVPTDLWIGMLARGWKVLSPDNFYLPTAQGVTSNPCSTPTASPSAGPTTGPTTSPTNAPSTTPVASPSTTGANPQPSVTPSPTPTSCSGPACSGGVIGE